MGTLEANQGPRQINHGGQLEVPCLVTSEAQKQWNSSFRMQRMIIEFGKFIVDWYTGMGDNPIESAPESLGAAICCALADFHMQS